MTAVRQWWERRTLHARLAVLISGAVAAAVLSVAVAAWVAVAEIQHHRLRTALSTDAVAVAAAGPPVAAPERRNGDGRRGPRGWGPRRQILDSTGTVREGVTDPLPVTDLARRVATGGGGQTEEEIRVGDDTYLMVTVPVTGGGAVQVAIDQDGDEQTLAAFGLLLVVFSALGIAGAVFLGRVVARAGLAPVQRLTEAVEDVAVTMDFRQPVAVGAGGDDEVARLSASVNTMLAAVDTARRAQRALVADAGHELRTPLTSLRTNIELLVDVERHPEIAHRLSQHDRDKLLADLEAQIGELSKLTTELIELSREETTREAAEPVALADVVEAAISRVRIRAPRLTFRADLTTVTVPGRPGELERMLVNVLDNAAKWSPAGATVHTALTVDGDECLVTVADSGPGIDEADRPYVFDRFYRAATARSAPGSGLGLAIVAQTAAQHGGTVTTSGREPHGTVVTIRLPQLVPAVPTAGLS
ncbi:HAMP domain-containing sensor histidine kinase [Actinoplanes derwentensis]|uniref:histidine kinase n=1 Tax=Actinoplanes derwentensis TaxID=113562 RepID=A0A1H1XZ90_9ACTN|nr:HAMP domain-containing sensor histidine kinase [Actinoplanes derwentensis]GID89780.1 two-component sensor histidine kinase [Actinoplanes derwentensis]SDT14568.1 two-component system, OmpR family, sensor histidine kinase MprB [Actinoplanes derwentensis]